VVSLEARTNEELDVVRTARRRAASRTTVLFIVAVTAVLVAGSAVAPARLLGQATAATIPTASKSDISVHYNEQYGPEAIEQADVYRSTSVRGWRPAVLIVHGGGWHEGSKGGWNHVAGQLADAGFVVVVANYFLSTPTQSGFPRELHQLKAAIEWMRANSATFGIDGRHIGALGSSAGGNLVAMLATDAYGPLDSGNRLGAAITWSGILDLATQPGLTNDIPQYVGCHVDCRAVLNDASPLHHVSGGDTPIELFNSTHELVPYRTVQAMDAALTASQVVHKLVIYDGSEHGVDYGDQAMPDTIAFLHQQLG
jgi:acetyl esterase